MNDNMVVLLITAIILAGIVALAVIFFDKFKKAIGGIPVSQPARQDQPLPRADYTKYIWSGETIGQPPAKKTLKLTYDNPERILLTFFADFSGTRNAYLDPVKAIRINGEIVEIKDLPPEPEKLRSVKKENVDVTKYIQTNEKGIPNDFEVNYIVRGFGGRLKGSVGKMTLVLSVLMPQSVVKGVGRETKFCMSCSSTIPAKGAFCWNCGVPQEAFSTTETYKCKVCANDVPVNATFCSKCGEKLPGARGQPAATKPAAEAAAVPQPIPTI